MPTPDAAGAAVAMEHGSSADASLVDLEFWEGWVRGSDLGRVDNDDEALARERAFIAEGRPTVDRFCAFIAAEAVQTARQQQPPRPPAMLFWGPGRNGPPIRVDLASWVATMRDPVNPESTRGWVRYHDEYPPDRFDCARGSPHNAVIMDALRFRASQLRPRALQSPEPLRDLSVTPYRPVPRRGWVDRLLTDSDPARFPVLATHLRRDSPWGLSSPMPTVPFSIPFLFFTDDRLAHWLNNTLSEPPLPQPRIQIDGHPSTGMSWTPPPPPPPGDPDAEMNEADPDAARVVPYTEQLD